MEAGLLAIEQAGLLPLSIDFQAGYQRMADMVSNEDDYDRADR